MPTPNILPRNDNEGNIGKIDKRWQAGFFYKLNAHYSNFLKLLTSDERTITGYGNNVIRELTTEVSFTPSHLLITNEGFVEIIGVALLLPDFQFEVTINLSLYKGEQLLDKKFIKIKDQVLSLSRILAIPFSLSLKYMVEEPGEYTARLDIESSIGFPGALFWQSNNIRIFIQEITS